MRLKEPDARMRDAELFIRFFAFRNFSSTYSGSMKQILDYTAKYFNDRWDSVQPTINEQTVEFERCIKTCIEIFGQNAFRKWNGTQYESAFNRAVFDALFLTLINIDIAHVLLENKQTVEDLFKALCTYDEKFKSAIEGTTKSIGSIYTRINIWTTGLRTTLGYPNIPTVQLIDNRIAISD